MAMPDRFHFLTAPIVKVWEGLLRRGMDAKKDFELRCEQIEQFYSGAADFMWSPKYMNKFMGGTTGLVPPKFQICMNKASEFIDVMKPMLFWQMADRKVRPHRTLQLDPLALFGIRMPPEGQQPDPSTQQLLEYASGLAAQQAEQDAKNVARAEVLEHMLNYFQREQPGGGLSNHINVCLDEALLYGCAFLATESYRFPKSDKTLVKSVRIPVKDVLVDPDCTDPLWLDAKWIAIRHEWSFVETERYFGLPPGSLRNYGTKMTSGAGWQRGSGLPPTQMRDNKKDLIEWYEVFSRAGCGNELAGVRQEIEPEFDAALDGNCAYLCIAKGCPFPLNLPSGELIGGKFSDEQQAGTEPVGAPVEWVTNQLRWPTEYWRDDKWPVSKLVFKPHSSSGLWPEPPLAPAIGELTCLNILVSAYVQSTYDNKTSLCAVIKGAVDNIKEVMNGSVPFFEVNPNAAGMVNDSIKSMIQFMERPEINRDVPATISFLMQLIEQRTGMSPRLYGANSGAAPRSATESEALQGSVNLRPQYMQRRCAEWMSAVADLEVFCSWSHVQADDIADVLGPLGAEAWRMLVTEESEEVILRGSKCYVEASEMSRPSKENDRALLDRMAQTIVPILAGYGAQTGDYAPLNGWFKAVGDASEIDVAKFLIPPQEPDQQAQQMQQATAAATLQKLQAETAKLQADAQATAATAQAAGMDGQNAQQQRMLDFQLKQADAATKQELAQHDAQLRAASAEHDMSLKQQDAALKQQTAMAGLAISAQEAQLKAASTQQDMQLKAAQAAQDADLKQQEFQFGVATKAGEAQMTAAQREQSARQDMILNMLKARQGMDAAAATHEQSLDHNEQKLQDSIRLKNITAAHSMLMAGLRSQSTTNGSAK